MHATNTSSLILSCRLFTFSHVAVSAFKKRRFSFMFPWTFCDAIKRKSRRRIKDKLIMKDKQWREKPSCDALHLLCRLQRDNEQRWKSTGLKVLFKWYLSSHNFVGGGAKWTISTLSRIVLCLQNLLMRLNFELFHNSRRRINSRS